MPTECPEIDELELMAQGVLPAERVRAVRAHAAECRDCAEMLGDIRANLRFLGDVREVLSTIHAPPPDPNSPSAGETGATGGLGGPGLGLGLGLGGSGTSSRGSTVVPPAPAPTQVGPYRIVRELGRGGMGVVYEAEQASPKRRVALKLTNAAYTTGSYHERLFLSEVHALARLNDPGIAAIYEAGRSEDGRAYYAMELVTGKRLDHACAARPVREKLALFARVCSAVAAAHERGVVHRDLKPSNIVISDRGEPKVLDFGLARVSEPEWAGAGMSPATQPGRVAGTVPYMSPEQARGEPDAIDIRSDVYSLGVVLYQVLIGKMPYDVPTGNVVRAAEVIATATPEPPGKLDRSLDGDIETIVLTALEKDPARRYRSARELGQDIQRLLTNRPIEARPPTASYLMTKFLARHRAWVMAGGVFLAVLVGFAAAMTWMYLDAAHDRERAENAEGVARQKVAQAEKAEQESTEQADLAKQSAQAAQSVRAFMVAMFRIDTDTTRPNGGEITARELLNRAAERLKASSATAEPSGRAALLDAVGLAYSNLGIYTDACRLLDESLTIRRKLYEDRGMPVVETAAALGYARMALDDLKGSEEAYRLAVEAGRLSPDGGHWHDALMQVRLADAVFRQGRGEDAEAILVPAIERLRKEPKAMHLLPMALNALAGAYETQRKFPQAAGAMREAIAFIAPHAGPDSDTLATLKANLATVLAQTGEHDEALTLAQEALAIRRRVLPPSHPLMGSSLSVLGTSLLSAGRADEAIKPLEQAIAIYEAAGYPPAHQDLITARAALAEAQATKNNPTTTSAPTSAPGEKP